MNSNLKPYVSIIMPTFNHAKFINKAITSVINQTFKNWELIIIDNNSIDETKKIIGDYTDSRIKYFKISNNGILAKSRNLGVKIAEGEWVAFLDSDDWWTKNKLSICIKQINKNVDFIYHKLEVINKSKKLFKKNFFKGRHLKRPILNDLLVSTITKGNPIGQSSAMMRRKLILDIGGINEKKNLVGAEDYNTWLRIAKITDKFKYIDKNLGFIFIHDFNISNKNMSIPQKLAIKDFKNMLTYEQTKNLKVKLKYLSGSYNFSKKNYYSAKKDFIYVVKNGFMHLKVRALLKILFLVLGLR